MKVVKTESSNKAKSIGFDGQVVHNRSDDGRRAEHEISREDETDLEESIAKYTSRMDTGQGGEENEKNVAPIKNTAKGLGTYQTTSKY